MNLIFRLLWTLLTARFGAPHNGVGEIRVTFRCLPTDLDLNLHMTNSRYHSFMDLCRMDLLVRSGAWKRLRAAGFNPVLGSSSIRFRRPIDPFQRFDVTARVLSWDERWIYIEQKFMVNGEAAAVALVKTAFLAKDGRAPMARVTALMGHDGPSPPATPLLEKKNELDVLLKG